jgi:hypothetical protein
LFEKKVSIHCILTIRDILEKHPEYKHIDEFLDYYKTNFNNSIIIKLEEYDYGQDCWNEYDYNITINEIDKECSGRTIKNLLNSKTDITAINQEIVDAKKKFANTEIDCYNEICNMCK